VFWRPDEDDGLSAGLAQLDFPCKCISLVPFRDEGNGFSILHPAGWLRKANQRGIDFYSPDAGTLPDPEPNVQIYALGCTLRVGRIPHPPEDEAAFLHEYLTGLMNGLDDLAPISQGTVTLATGQAGLLACFDYRMAGTDAFRAYACVAMRKPDFFFYLDYTGVRLEVEKMRHTIHNALMQSRLEPMERANKPTGGDVQ
jgi:hypothetical protein